MPISFELAGPDRRDAPPFSDGCPKCRFDGAVIPFATFTEGDTLLAFYEHGRCGHQWQTSFTAKYAPNWERVIGDGGQSAIAA
jgi:hypothetical protein